MAVFKKISSVWQGEEIGKKPPSHFDSSPLLCGNTSNEYPSNTDPFRQVAILRYIAKVHRHTYNQIPCPPHHWFLKFAFNIWQHYMSFLTEAPSNKLEGTSKWEFAWSKSIFSLSNRAEQPMENNTSRYVSNKILWNWYFLHFDRKIHLFSSVNCSQTLSRTYVLSSLNRTLVYCCYVAAVV